MVPRCKLLMMSTLRDKSARPCYGQREGNAWDPYARRYGSALLLCTAQNAILLLESLFATHATPELQRLQTPARHLNTCRTCKHAVALYAARIDHISSPSYSTSRGTSVKALAVITRLSSLPRQSAKDDTLLHSSNHCRYKHRLTCTAIIHS